MIDTRNNIRIPSGVSRDGKLIAYFSIGEPQEDLFVGLVNGPIRRITDDASRDRAPVFTPDGKSLVFYSNREAGWGVWSIGVDGGGLRKIAIPAGGAVYALVSPQGDQIIYVDQSGRNVFVVPSNGSAPPRGLTGTVTDGRYFAPYAWSPDGKRLAGTLSNASGRPSAVGVYDLATSVTTPIADEIAYAVQWLPDGRHIVCFGKNGQELVVYDTTTRVRTVVDVRLPGPAVDEMFAISPDGRMIYYGATRTEADIWIVESR